MVVNGFAGRRSPAVADHLDRARADLLASTMKAMLTAEAPPGYRRAVTGSAVAESELRIPLVVPSI
jgi:hypothetical protein